MPKARRLLEVDPEQPWAALPGHIKQYILDKAEEAEEENIKLLKRSIHEKLDHHLMGRKGAEEALCDAKRMIRHLIQRYGTAYMEEALFWSADGEDDDNRADLERQAARKLIWAHRKKRMAVNRKVLTSKIGKPYSKQVHFPMNPNPY